MGNCCVARPSSGNGKRRNGGGGGGANNRGGRLGGANMRSCSAISSVTDAGGASHGWAPVTVLGKGLAPEATAEELLRR